MVQSRAIDSEPLGLFDGIAAPTGTRMSTPTESAPTHSSSRRPTLWPLVALASLLLWAYWPMLSVFAGKWIYDPQYSHGILVPLFSAYLLRRAWRKGPVTLEPKPFVGYGILVVAFGMRVVAGSLLFHQLDAISLLLVFVGVSLAVGGRPLLKRIGPAIAFLVFMIPLPYELERNVGQPLKVAATESSTYLLQTLGQPAIRDGNLILIDEIRLGVVDACSGLKMLVTFAAFSVGAVLLMERSRFEKLMVVMGIIPIAIATNVLRITATGLCYTIISSKNTMDFIHDLYGWLMMPIGLGLLALEVWILKRLVVQPNRTESPAMRLGFAV
jgi:exosortase